MGEGKRKRLSGWEAARGCMEQGNGVRPYGKAFFRKEGNGVRHL